MAGVEELYKQFGILADANEKAGEVNLKIFLIKLNMAPVHHVEVQVKPFLFILCKPNGRNCSQLLLLTARGCFFVDFGCCEGITGRETAGFSVHNKILQVLPQVARKCY